LRINWKNRRDGGLGGQHLGISILKYLIRILWKNHIFLKLDQTFTKVILEVH